MKKLIDAVKYVGKNFWKVLPVGSSINYVKKQKEEGELIEDNYTFKGIFHDLYALGGVFALSGYLGVVSMTNSCSPKKQIKELNRIENEKRKQEYHERFINSEYERMFERENPKTFQDSVDVYQKYGLPIKLLEPTIKEKENLVNKIVGEFVK
jgi:hypothetical protein